jgi:hypothetical protein
MCSLPGPWQRSQPTPSCRNGTEPYRFDAPGAGGWIRLAWQKRQAGGAGFSSISRGGWYSGDMFQPFFWTK